MQSCNKRSQHSHADRGEVLIGWGPTKGCTESNASTTPAVMGCSLGACFPARGSYQQRGEGQGQRPGLGRPFLEKAVWGFSVLPDHHSPAMLQCSYSYGDRSKQKSDECVWVDLKRGSLFCPLFNLVGRATAQPRRH